MNHRHELAWKAAHGRVTNPSPAPGPPAIARRVCLGTSKSANIRLHAWLAKAAASAPTPGPPQ
jgi:hypothetical protein